MKTVRIIIVALLVSFIGKAKAQIDIQGQLNEIPPMVSQYIDFLMYDITNYQGSTYLNSMNTTGKVLDQWKMSIGLNMGTALIPGIHAQPLTFGNNFTINGSESSIYWSGPNLFGSTGEGDIFFRFINEELNGPVYDPLTGDEIGFSVPLIAGLGTGVAFSPAIMPKISLGLGYGTEVMVGALPGAMKPIANALPGDLSIAKDMMYAVGLKHDVFNWVPMLKERDYHFTLGASYSSMLLGLELGEGKSLFEGSSQSDYYTMEDRFEGVTYSLSGLGFDAIATKSIKFVDLSVFASLNQYNYQIKSDGEIAFSVNTAFKKESDEVWEDFVVNDLIDVDNEVKSFLYGAAVQLNFGGFSWGIKYGHQPGAKTEIGKIAGTHYFSTSLSGSFSLSKKKEAE